MSDAPYVIPRTAAELRERIAFLHDELDCMTAERDAARAAIDALIQRIQKSPPSEIDALLPDPLAKLRDALRVVLDAEWELRDTAHMRILVLMDAARECGWWEKPK